MFRRHITLSKIDKNCPLAILNQISTISMHISNLVKIHWCLLIIQKKKILTCHGQTTLSKIDEICPLAFSYQISTISMHIPSLVKICWHLHKLLSRNKNTDWGHTKISDWHKCQPLLLSWQIPQSNCLYFSYFSKKITFCANCLLSRKNIQNGKVYFLGKIRKTFQNVVCWNFYPAC